MSWVPNTDFQYFVLTWKFWFSSWVRRFKKMCCVCEELVFEIYQPCSNVLAWRHQSSEVRQYIILSQSWWNFPRVIEEGSRDAVVLQLKYESREARKVMKSVARGAFKSSEQRRAEAQEQLKEKRGRWCVFYFSSLKTSWFIELCTSILGESSFFESFIAFIICTQTLMCCWNCGMHVLVSGLRVQVWFHGYWEEARAGTASPRCLVRSLCYKITKGCAMIFFFTDKAHVAQMRTRL